MTMKWVWCLEKGQVFNFSSTSLFYTNSACSAQRHRSPALSGFCFYSQQIQWEGCRGMELLQNDIICICSLEFCFNLLCFISPIREQGQAPLSPELFSNSPAGFIWPALPFTAHCLWLLETGRPTVLRSPVHFLYTWSRSETLRGQHDEKLHERDTLVPIFFASEVLGFSYIICQLIFPIYLYNG